MLTLYVDPNCDRCRQLDSRMQDYHLAHRVEQASAGDPAPPHALRDDEELIQGHDAIAQRIEMRYDLMERTNRYQSGYTEETRDEQT